MSFDSSILEQDSIFLDSGRWLASVSLSGQKMWQIRLCRKSSIIQGWPDIPDPERWPPLTWDGHQIAEFDSRLDAISYALEVINRHGNQIAQLSLPDTGIKAKTIPGTLDTEVNMSLGSTASFEARAQRYKTILQGIPAVAITLHDATTPDFLYIDLHAPLPERLNKSREFLIGKPIYAVAAAIAEPKRHYINKALKNGQCETYRYVYEDDHVWRFRVSIVPLYGREEVLAITQDDEAETWQLGYWLNKRQKLAA